MYNYNKIELKDSSGVSIGYVYKFSGEIVSGLQDLDIFKLKDISKAISEDSINQVILIDFRKLIRWDSLGITTLIPSILESNKKLKEKGRALIGIVGDESKDIYRALKDKYGDNVSEETLPWFESENSFVESL